MDQDTAKPLAVIPSATVRSRSSSLSINPELKARLGFNNSGNCSNNSSSSSSSNSNSNRDNIVSIISSTSGTGLAESGVGVSGSGSVFQHITDPLAGTSETYISSQSLPSGVITTDITTSVAPSPISWPTGTYAPSNDVSLIPSRTTTSHVERVTPIQLGTFLSNQCTDCDTAPTVPHPPQSSPLSSLSPSSSVLLLIDLRTRAEFDTTRLRGSVNVNLPPLILKRLRKGIVSSSFNIENFLTTAACREKFEAWKTAVNQAAAVAGPTVGGAKSVIIVYDDEMEEDVEAVAGCGDEGWVLLKVLATQFVDKAAVYALMGGFRAFLDTPDAADCLEGIISSTVTANRSVSPAGVSIGMLKIGSFGDDDSRCGVKAVSLMTQVELDQTPSQESEMPMVVDGGEANSSSRLALKLRSKRLDILASEVDSPSTITPTSSMISSPLSPITASGGGSPISLNQGSARKRRPLSFRIDTSPVEGIAPSLRTSAALSLSNSTSSPSQVGLAQLNVFSPPKPNSPSDVTTLVSPMLSPYTQIRNNLLLGSDEIPSSPDAVERLVALGITHVLNMAIEVSNPALEGQTMINYRKAGIEDHPDQDVEKELKEAVGFIHEAMSSYSNARVLVHCKAGKSRSVMVILAYLISTERLGLQAAYEEVQQRRKGIVPNIGFMLALMKYEKEILGEQSSS